MEIVNPFLLKNKARMIKFLDDLSAVDECPPSISTVDYEPSRELSIIHSICEIHFHEIVSMSHQNVSEGKLFILLLLKQMIYFFSKY